MISSQATVGEEFHGKLCCPCLMLQSKWVASLFLESWRIAQEGALGNTEKTESTNARGEVPRFRCPRPDAGLPNVSGRETLQDSLRV